MSSTARTHAIRLVKVTDRSAWRGGKGGIMTSLQWHTLSKNDQQLVNAAEAVMQTAYCPYSNFYVGAALLSTTGTIITGSNVENATEMLTICAERAAIVRANAKGIRTFRKIAIITRQGMQNTRRVTAPCGPCRQMLYETVQLSKSANDIEIILSTTAKDTIVITSLRQLLPLPYGAIDKGTDLSAFKSELAG